QQVAEERRRNAVRDEVGNVVPQELLEVFAEREAFDRHAQALREVTAFLGRVGQAKAGKYLLARARVASRDTHQDIVRARPYSLCAACKGKGTGCDHCLSTGYLDESSYKAQKKSQPELFDGQGMLKE